MQQLKLGGDGIGYRYGRKRRQAEADLAGLSLLDDLAGIPNQYCFDQTIGRKYTRARRASIPLSLILIKIDYYVAFQRHYGNQVAEDRLCQVAIGLTRILKRPTDLVARCINEQFLHRFRSTRMSSACNAAV